MSATDPFPFSWTVEQLYFNQDIPKKIKIWLMNGNLIGSLILFKSKEIKRGKSKKGTKRILALWKYWFSFTLSKSK